MANRVVPLISRWRPLALSPRLSILLLSMSSMLCFLHEFCRQMLTSVILFIRLLESVLSVSVEKITTVSGLISLINDLRSIRLFVTSSAE